MSQPELPPALAERLLESEVRHARHHQEKIAEEILILKARSETAGQYRVRMETMLDEIRRANKPKPTTPV